MRVVALVSFTGRIGTDTRSFRKGSEFELPEGVDWLQAGFVQPVAPVATPAPHLQGVEKAVVDLRRERAEMREEQHGLMDVAGIGARLAKKLAAQGVTTPGQLLAADPTALAQALGLSVETVKTWQVNARLLVEGE